MMEPLAVFIGIGLVFSLWVLSRSGSGWWIDMLLDPKGSLSLILVICVATMVLGLVILDGIKAAASFLAANAAVLALVVLVPVAAGVMLLRRSRRGSGFDF